MRMVLQDELLNRWIEYGGGSRPGSYMIRFAELDDSKLVLQIRYIFDWNTMETVLLNFTVTRDELNQLISQLVDTGHATLQKESEKEKLFFEWRQTDGRILLRIEGRNRQGRYGSAQYRMEKFAELMLNLSA